MDDNDEKEIDRLTAILHERRAKMLELLRAEPRLRPEEEAAVIYTLSIEPGIREHIPGVVMTSMAQHAKRMLSDQARTCQCANCKAQRAQA